MSYSQSLSIAAASDVKSLELTAYGKIIASSYPAPAIAFADKEMALKKGKVEKPMGLFTSICRQYCDRNGLRPNFSRLQEFKNNNPGWESLPEYEAITIQPSCPSTSTAKKSGTSGILPPGTVLPGFEEVSAQIQARNAADRGDCAAERSAAGPEGYRDPATFDRTGEWTQFVLEGKRRLAAGDRINPFWHREIDQYDKAIATNADVSALPIQALVRLGVTPNPSTIEPLGEAQIKVINKVIAHRDLLGDGESANLVVEKINDLLSTGASHPLATDNAFWQAMLYVTSIIDLQSAIV